LSFAGAFARKPAPGTPVSSATSSFAPSHTHTPTSRGSTAPHSGKSQTPRTPHTYLGVSKSAVNLHMRSPNLASFSLAACSPVTSPRSARAVIPTSPLRSPRVPALRRTQVRWYTRGALCHINRSLLPKNGSLLPNNRSLLTLTHSCVPQVLERQGSWATVARQRPGCGDGPADNALKYVRTAPWKGCG